MNLPIIGFQLCCRHSGKWCGSCIQDAIDEIEEFDDTAYVFICNSEKDFYLQSGGKKASSFRNLYLDKKKITARLDMVQTYPNVYLLTNGDLISKTPYKSRKRLAEKQKRLLLLLIRIV